MKIEFSRLMYYISVFILECLSPEMTICNPVSQQSFEISHLIKESTNYYGVTHDRVKITLCLHANEYSPKSRNIRSFSTSAFM